MRAGLLLRRGCKGLHRQRRLPQRLLLRGGIIYAHTGTPGFICRLRGSVYTHSVCARDVSGRIRPGELQAVSRWIRMSAGRDDRALALSGGALQSEKRQLLHSNRECGLSSLPGRNVELAHTVGEQFRVFIVSRAVCVWSTRHDSFRDQRPG